MNENENFCKAIEQAVVLPCAKEMQLISDEKCDFSSAYRRRIRRLTKNQDKTPHSLIKTTLQKMIFIIAAMLMIGSITVAAVPPLREWFVGLFASSNDNNTDVWNVHGDVPADDLTDAFVCCEPTYIPNGFAEQDRTQEETMLIIDYSSNNEFIEYTQSSILTNNQIDTQNRTTEKVSINDNDALLSYDADTSTIAWTDGRYSYTITGDLCKSDIIKMADSVNSTK